ncbi:hypothetical protein HDV57DRAFT_25717 [Trichoderma longibrachiatum]
MLAFQPWRHDLPPLQAQAPSIQCVAAGSLCYTLLADSSGHADGVASGHASYQSHLVRTALPPVRRSKPSAMGAAFEHLPGNHVYRPFQCCCCYNCCLLAFLPTTSAGVRHLDNTYNSPMPKHKRMQTVDGWRWKKCCQQETIRSQMRLLAPPFTARLGYCYSQSIGNGNRAARKKAEGRRDGKENCAEALAQQDVIAAASCAGAPVDHTPLRTRLSDRMKTGGV